MKHLTITLLVLTVAVEAEGPRLFQDKEFHIYSDAEFRNAKIMGCLAHRHGSPEEATAKLRGLLRVRSNDTLSSIGICRIDQLATLKRYAPLVDQVFIHPFVHTRTLPSEPEQALRLDSNHPPGPRQVLWFGFNHPIINYLRVIRSTAPDTRLIARIDLRGTTTIFFDKIRNATFEEIEWMAFAAIGSHFQGLVWQNVGEDIMWFHRLRMLEHNLMCFSRDLGLARPVDWVSSAGKGQPVSVLASNTSLFVVLLNPDYMILGESGTVRYPVDMKARSGEILLSLPERVEIESGSKLDGTPLVITKEATTVRVSFRFSGGGEMLILSLQHGK